MRDLSHLLGFAIESSSVSVSHPYACIILLSFSLTLSQPSCGRFSKDYRPIHHAHLQHCPFDRIDLNRSFAVILGEPLRELSPQTVLSIDRKR